MKAAVLEAFREPLVLRNVPDPSLSPNGAVVRVAANGICRSDWHAWAGHWPDSFPLPHVLGHEMCGVVEAVGSDATRHRPGDRIIVPFSGGDGSCPMCAAGLANLCENPVVPGFRSWGGFAEYVAIDHADFNLVPLPEAVDFAAGAGMGCRFMTAFHGLTDRAGVRPGEWVAVFGCGGDLSLPVDLIIDREIFFAGSKGMPPADYGAMLDMVADGLLNPGRLVSRKVPLEEAGTVLASMDSFDTLGFTVIDRY